MRKVEAARGARESVPGVEDRAMREAIRLAKPGNGPTQPNPLVGPVGPSGRVVVGPR